MVWVILVGILLLALGVLALSRLHHYHMKCNSYANVPPEINVATDVELNLFFVDQCGISPIVMLLVEPAVKKKLIQYLMTSPEFRFVRDDVKVVFYDGCFPEIFGRFKIEHSNKIPIGEKCKYEGHTAIDFHFMDIVKEEIKKYIGLELISSARYIGLNALGSFFNIDKDYLIKSLQNAKIGSCLLAGNKLSDSLSTDEVHFIDITIECIARMGGRLEKLNKKIDHFEARRILGLRRV